MSVKTPEPEQDTIDFIADLRNEYLQIMIWGTLILLGLLAVSLQAAPAQGLSLSHVLLALSVFGICTAAAWAALARRHSYFLAAYFYIGGMGGSVFVAMLLLPPTWELYVILPFMFLCVIGAAGVLLPGNSVYALCGICIFSLLLMRDHYSMGILVAGVSLILLMTAIAQFTARSLYQVTNTIADQYLRARERRDSLYEIKRDLEKTLKERHWLYQELESTHRALETSHEVGRQITLILELNTLLSQVVMLIQEAFGYYFVGVWLPDERKESLVLRAGVMRQAQTNKPLRTLIIPGDAQSIIADAYRFGKYRHVDDVLAETDYFAIPELPDTRSVLALPLTVGSHVIGVLDIEQISIGAFNTDDRGVIQALANQISVAIRNAELYALEKQRRRLAESLEETGRVLASSLDLREVPARILEQLALVVPYARGSVLVQEGDVLRSIAQRGFPLAYQTTEFTIPIRAGDLFEQVVSNHKPLLIDDTTVDQRYQLSQGLEINHSFLGVPLIVKDRVVGIISLTRREVGAFTHSDAQLVQAFTGQAAIALENARLMEEIRTVNRRLERFNEELEQKVTERTEELNRAYRTLEKMDRNKSDFIEIAAHELRTPLSVLKGYTQVLAATLGNSSDDSIKSMIEGILSGADRLHAIVNSMLEVARLDSQTLKLVKQPLYFDQLFRKIAADFRPALTQRRLALTYEGLDSLPVIQGDRQLLLRVFDELISNAVKYTPDGGAITVTGKTYADGETGFVHVIISDSGIGIDPEHHEIIFEKFYQTGEVSVHSSGRTTFKGGGPGLGLAIVRGAIKAHGGRVWVESPGHDEAACPGSQFHVLLPIDSL